MKPKKAVMLCVCLPTLLLGCVKTDTLAEDQIITSSTKSTEAEYTADPTVSAETVTPEETNPATVPSVTEGAEPPVTDSEAETTETIPGHQHKYTSQFFEARCAQFPYTLYTCSCGHSYKQVDESKPPNDHKYSFAYTPLADSIWSESMQATCDVCGDTYTTTVHARTLDAEIISQIEARTIYWLNEYRKAEGAGACTAPAVFQSVAGYRASQLMSNFSHNVADLREACAQFEYGEYKQPEGWDPSEYYYTFNGAEAIANGFVDPAGVDATAKYLADLIRNSPPHWCYVGDARFSCMAVGIAYKPGKIVGVVFVSQENYG